MVTKKEITEAALELFWENSYNSVGINTICQKANIQKGSFYHYFKSKDELALEVLDLVWQQNKAEMQDFFSDTSISPLSRFQAFGQKMHEKCCIVTQEHGIFLGCPFGNFATEMSTQNQKVRAKIDTIFTAEIQMIATLLEEAQNAGEITNTIDSYTLASLINSCVQGSSIMAKIKNDPTLIGKSIHSLLAPYITDPKVLELS